jgi:uncharacterized protein with PIN domain
MYKAGYMRFAADCMLGKLAKWLKILGFDTIFFSRIEDEELISISREEGRVLLTRDTGIMSKAKDFRSLFIDSEDWHEQVRQVLDELEIRDEVKPYSRCIDCNTVLKELSRSGAKNLVTPFVYEHADAFSLCPDCGRVFWRGTHFKDMEIKLNRLLK